MPEVSLGPGRLDLPSSPSASTSEGSLPGEIGLLDLAPLDGLGDNGRPLPRWPFSTELKDLLAPIVYNAIAR